jgi:hypothetical protein
MRTRNTPTHTTILFRDNHDGDDEALYITMHLLSNNIEARLLSLYSRAPAISECIGQIRLTRHIPISKRTIGHILVRIHLTCSSPLGSRCPDLKRFLNNVVELPVVTDDSLAIHRNAERSRSIYAANAVSFRIRHYKGERSQGDRGSVGDGARLGIEAAGALTRYHSTSTIPESPAMFQSPRESVPGPQKFPEQCRRTASCY